MLTLRSSRRNMLVLHPPYAAHPLSTTQYPLAAVSARRQNDGVVSYFREWFLTRNQQQPLVHRIFTALRSNHDSFSPDVLLSRFNLHLSESLVLQVLNYDRDDVLTNLKFFDWAGRQPGFHHTRSTFNSIFKILSRAKPISLMLDFLQTYTRQRYANRGRYYNTLVIGYSVAGRPEIAIQLFGKMRFIGVDLDDFSYHVLLNSLVEKGGYDDLVESLAEEIRIRGWQSEVTHTILIKGICRRSEWGKAEEYLRNMLKEGAGNGIMVGTVVRALLRNQKIEKSKAFIEEVRGIELASAADAYGIWVAELVKSGKLDDAMEFLKEEEEFVLDVGRYNGLIYRLLRRNRLEEVFDLLGKMREKEVVPNDRTMNAVICFLCKVGRVDVAVELYDLREEIGLSVSRMTYNYLINVLAGDLKVDEMYRMLRNSVEKGYFVKRRPFSVVVDALSGDGRLAEMIELARFALDRKIMLNSLSYNRFIAALCKHGRVEEGYALHGLLGGLYKESQKKSYINVIRGYSKLSRAAEAAEFLIEMQEKGYKPSWRLARRVVCSLLRMGNSEDKFWKLLETQLYCGHLPTAVTYNLFIDGAGHAKMSDLARKVYETMRRNGHNPNIHSDVMMLRSYVKSKRISDACRFFNEVLNQKPMRMRNRKLWHVLILGLCRAKRPLEASNLLRNMEQTKLRPSIECYEELVKACCESGLYDKAICIVNDMTQMGRPVSSFMGNIFLLHALRTRDLYSAWVSWSHKQTLTEASWMLGNLIGQFCGLVEVPDDEELEKLIRKCFPVDTYTINMMLRRSSIKGADDARNLFEVLSMNGYEPNEWTYDTVARAFARDGRMAEARAWMEKMLQEGVKYS